MKTLTKKEFVDGYMPVVNGKEVVVPKIDLLPNNKCRINGNLYSIKINEEQLVELVEL